MSAKRTDCEILPLPENKVEIPFTRAFSEVEFLQISDGFIPQDMEDKWFIYLEENTLFLYRSWTGYCIYVLEFNDQHQAVRAWANRDPSQYKNTDTAYDIDLLNNLIDHFLLNKPWSAS